jgi:hypothetical protein
MNGESRPRGGEQCLSRCSPSGRAVDSGEVGVRLRLGRPGSANAASN